MKKITAICLLFVVVQISAQAKKQFVAAQTTLVAPVPPVIPAVSFNVIDFGAVADGRTLNTDAIQHTIDKAADGGTIIIPAGIFLCGPIVLHSKINLQISKNAVLLFSNDIDRHPIVNNRYQNFIAASHQSDIKISGEGTINGQGEIWWTKFRAKKLTYTRPQLIYLDNCERVEVSGITCLNPPNTHVSMKLCKEVMIKGITITAPANSANTDGLNLSVKNCLVTGCKISTGDDNIAINFGGKGTTAGPECESIAITNCFFGYGHGLSIGSYTSGNLKGLTVSNCSFEGTTAGIRMKSTRGRGGLVEDVNYRNITMEKVKNPVFISAYYPKEPIDPANDIARPVGATTPHFKNITLTNISCRGSDRAVTIWGVPEMPVEQIIFDHVNISATKGMLLYNVKGLLFINSTINSREGEPIKEFNADVKGL